MATFKAGEILKIAVAIEENGENLYRHAKTLTDDPKVQDLFGFLAGEEARHKSTFEELASKLESYEPPETYPGEYMAYLKAYAENIVFPPDQMEEELDDLDDVEDAVEFAMQREIESILYYIETRAVVPASHGPTIDKIVEEERKHYLKLVEIRRDLD